MVSTVPGGGRSVKPQAEPKRECSGGCVREREGEGV